MKLCICSTRPDRDPAIDDLNAFRVDGTAVRAPEAIRGLASSGSAI